MALGLAWLLWSLLEKLTHLRVPFRGLVNFYSRSRKQEVVGEKVTSRARTRLNEPPWSPQSSETVLLLLRAGIQFKLRTKRCCGLQVYTSLEGGKSHVVGTAWALLALIAAGQVTSQRKVNHRIVVQCLPSQLCRCQRLGKGFYSQYLYVLKTGLNIPLQQHIAPKVLRSAGLTLDTG